jgi:hypothetical protein
MSIHQLTGVIYAAFDFAAKKSGHTVDRSTGEKITDAGRSAYEKVTGYAIQFKDFPFPLMLYSWTSANGGA